MMNAVVGLAIIVLMAAGFHLRADERLNAIEAGLWAGLAAVIINLIVLFRRPANNGTTEGDVA